jgi:stearoyl-CoA desaturase (delta-9 desaturase)
VNLSDFVYFFCCSKINPVENKLVSVLSGGEGWHNFHNIFPSDYRASEYGHKHDTNSAFIEIMQKIGWAYDLKNLPNIWSINGSRNTAMVVIPFIWKSRIQLTKYRTSKVTNL